MADVCAFEGDGDGDSGGGFLQIELEVPLSTTVLMKINRVDSKLNSPPPEGFP